MNMDNDTIRNLAITFFFAVYWGAMISSMPKFAVFQIWTFTRKGHGLRIVGRLVYGIFILNIFPMALFWFIYHEPWFTIVPRILPKALLCAGIASLSVFSAVFLLPGSLQLFFARFFYPDHKVDPKMSWEAESAKEHITSNDSAWVMLVTFLLYIVVPLLIAYLLAR